MKHPKRRQLPMLTLIIGLLGLLLLLATLQYNWVGQVSQAERERLQASMRIGAARFSEDFDRELARAYLGLQMNAVTLRDKTWEAYADRYDRWKATTPYPRLVRDVFLVELYEGRGLQLALFDPHERTFKPANWPNNLTDVRRRFEHVARSIHIESDRIVGIAPDQVAAEVPALLIPLSQTWLLQDLQAPHIEAELIEADFLLGGTTFTRPRQVCAWCYQAISGEPLFAYTIVTLDQAYLQQEFIPSLARRYLATGDELDVHLTIIGRDDPQLVVYRSDPRPVELSPASADAAASLLSVRVDEFNRLLLDNVFQESDQQANGDSRPRRIKFGVLGNPTPDESLDDVTVAGDANGRWLLLLTHRAGSLDVAVTTLRFRNLLISFGTLLLLAISVLVMVILARRTQRLAQQKMEFVMTISHELRTPLAVICSAGENLADGVVDDQQRTRQYGALIYGEGRRLAEMVEQVMEFAGAQSGRKTYNLRSTHVGDLVESTLAACRAQFAERGAQLDLEILADTRMIMADGAALRRCLLNLIGNALKYSPDSAWIGVRVEAGMGVLGTEVRITVRDRGMGIAPEDLPHIFEPFYRGRDVVAAQIHGSGLGLSLVKHVIEAHGGKVSVESAPGQGSAFTLHLPAGGRELRTKRRGSHSEHQGPSVA